MLARRAQADSVGIKVMGQDSKLLWIGTIKQPIEGLKLAMKARNSQLSNKKQTEFDHLILMINLFISNDLIENIIV